MDTNRIKWMEIDFRLILDVSIKHFLDRLFHILSTQIVLINF